MTIQGRGGQGRGGQGRGTQGRGTQGGSGSGERGAALLQVLLLVTIMSTIAVAVTEDLRFAASRLQNTRAADQATWYALGAEQLVAPLIDTARQADPQLMILAEPFTQTFPVEGGLIEIQVRDGANCFNVNRLVGGSTDEVEPQEAQAQALTLLLRDIGVNSSEARRIVGGIVDWIDPDGAPVSGGAESFDYALLDPPYRTPDRPIADISELRAIAGIDQATYLGLRPFLCARRGTLDQPLNINTLHPGQAVLLHAALEGQISVQQAAAVLDTRPADGFQSVADVWLSGPLADFEPQAFTDPFAISSEVFDVTILVIYGEAYIELRSTIRVPPSGGAEVIQRRFGAVS